jgi:hypothetical protein
MWRDITTKIEERFIYIFRIEMQKHCHYHLFS